MHGTRRGGRRVLSAPHCHQGTEARRLCGRLIRRSKPTLPGVALLRLKEEAVSPIRIMVVARDHSSRVYTFDKGAPKEPG
jgi:hypothetical protein